MVVDNGVVHVPFPYCSDEYLSIPVYTRQHVFTIVARLSPEL